MTQRKRRAQRLQIKLVPVRLLVSETAVSLCQCGTKKVRRRANEQQNSKKGGDLKGRGRGRGSGHTHTTQGTTSPEADAAEAEVRIGLTALGDGAGPATREVRFTSDGEPLATAAEGAPRGEGVSEGDLSPAFRVGVLVAALEYCCCCCCCFNTITCHKHARTYDVGSHSAHHVTKQRNVNVRVPTITALLTCGTCDK